ncbi:MAG: metallophosphoesterase [Arcobacteraceae bacterium]
MRVDILSDLHLDFYFKLHLTTHQSVTTFFKPIFTDNNSRDIGDVLIIAGDIGHYNHQNIEVLKIFQKEFYRYVICVLGNHDYYLIDSDARYSFENNSFKRVENIKTLINNEENIYCLDGNIIEIDGIKFGGCDSWYDNSYMQKYFAIFDKNYINLLWKQYMNDSRLIYGIKNFDDISIIEKEKLNKIYQSCDVMITHVNPSFDEQHIDRKYHNNPSNSFFTFNGSSFYQNGSMKYWVFGHTHDSIEYKIGNIKFLCNPLGYPHESEYGDTIKMKSFEI